MDAPVGPNGGPRTTEMDEDLVDALVQRLAPLRRYCRVEVEGLEHVPEGKAVLVANHTGAMGLDHVNLFTTVHEELDRTFHTAVHPTFFRIPLVRDLAPRLGMFEVSVTESTRVLDDDGLLLFFPEGEDGNFKPLWRYYELQAFHPGFAHVALAAEAPIVPVIIVGGEDANPSLGRVSWLEDKLDVPVPLPLNLLPLPAKWRIKFLPPIQPDRWMVQGDAVDLDLGERIAQELHDLMQDEVEDVLEARGGAFL